MKITNENIIALGHHIATALTEHETYLCYLGHVSRSYDRKDRALKWTVAAASCTPFIAKWQDVNAGGASWFLALVPLLAIGLPIIKISESVGDARELHGKISGSVAILKECFRILCLDGDSISEEKLKDLKAKLFAAEEALDKARGDKLKIPDIKELKDKAIKDTKPMVFPPPSSRDDSGGGRSVVNFSGRF